MDRFRNLTGLSPEQLLAKTKTLEPVKVQDLIDETGSKFKASIQFCCTVAVRSFLRHNGYNSLPKIELSYTPQAWHRAYKKEEIQKLLGYLPRKLHKLFVFLAVETGLRADTILELRYRHVMEDFEARIVPVAVRLEPRYHVGRKAAGYTFLGWASVEMLRECVDEGLTESDSDSMIVPRSYRAIYAAIKRAKGLARVDPSIQPCHGFRKYFENALDHAGIDHERKMILEGHFASTRARHYTDRDIDDLRELYRRSYQFIDLELLNTGRSGEHSQEMDLRVQLARYRALEKRTIVLETQFRKMQHSARSL